MKRVCVYCGSSRRADSVYLEAAVEMGRLLAERGLGLVYGGGTTGLMGAVADTVLERGGEVIGVIPGYFSPEIVHWGLTDLRMVNTMHERKALMIELADAFVALPGAYGTLDEFCEALAWAQLRLHDKPCGLLNVNRYFDPLLRFFDHAVAENFLKPEHRALLIVETDPELLLQNLGTDPTFIPARPGYGR